MWSADAGWHVTSRCVGADALRTLGADAEGAGHVACDDLCTLQCRCLGADAVCWGTWRVRCSDIMTYSHTDSCHLPTHH